MTLRELQRVAVDTIKRHALVISQGSPRAEAHVLTEYLWAEEGTESTALQQTAAAASSPPWLGKLIAHQLADERRHAGLLRERLAVLGIATRPPPALGRAKLWWLERTCARYTRAFAAGPIVVWLAIAAQLEATGVRMFERHLAVLDTTDPIAEIVHSIVADERRHAKSCAVAVERLVLDHERALLVELRARVAMIDRAFGVTLAVGFWVLLATLALRDRVVRS